MSKRKEITTWTFSPPPDFNYGDMKSRPLRRPPCEHRWIPVSERLPQDDENVLVFDPKCHGTHIAWCHKDSTGEIVWASQVYYGLEPTHWMPLPAPPTDAK